MAAPPEDSAARRRPPRLPDVEALALELSVVDDTAAGPAAEVGEPPGSGRSVAGLTPREAEVLAFERQWWKHPGSKEQAVRERFGVGPTRYYQVLNALLDREDAMRHDPMLVKRLRRARAQRRRTRTARRLGIEP